MDTPRKPEPIDPQIDRVIDAYIDHTIEDEPFETLCDWLREDAANRKAFARRLALHSEIAEWCTERSGESLAGNLDTDEGDSDLLPTIQYTYGTSDRRSKQKYAAALSYVLRHTFTPKRIAVLTTAAAVLLGVVLAVVLLSGPDENALIAGQEPADTAPETAVDPIVATLTAEHNAQWAQASLAPGSPLRAGDRFTLTQGFAEITTNRGAVAILEAPATIELTDKDNALRLHKGKLVGICETETSKGFIVRTAHMDITDIGTRFGVTVDPDGDVVAGVFDGAIDVVESVTNQTDPSRKIRLVAGEQIHADAEGEFAEAVTQIQPDHGYMLRWDAIQRRIGIQGQARFFNTPPTSVRQGEQLDSSRLIVFEESTVVLDQPLEAWSELPAFKPGKLITIPKGSRVVSYFIHFAPTDSGRVQATLTFPGRILGVAGGDKRLVQTNTLFGLDATAYSSETSNDFFTVDARSEDTFAISGTGGNVMTIALGAGTQSDQARVLVEVPDSSGEQP